MNTIGLSTGIETFCEIGTSIETETDQGNVELQDHMASPLKTQNSSAILEDIPSPFKTALFWPVVPKVTQKKKWEKVPSVATSKEWKVYHIKKENNKVQKQNEIEERKRKRQERKDQKVEKVIKKENTQTGSNNSNWFCFICEENIVENMIQCMSCKKWLHEKCGNVRPSTKKYFCPTCVL